MRLPFLAAGSARPLPVTPRPRIVAGQSQAGAATARLGAVRVVAQQGQAATAKARPKIVARQGQAATAKARTRIAARQSQRTTATATASLWPNGYRYQHEIRLRAWPGGGAPVPNFLLPFSETLTPFKTVANGGEVEHASGYDIRFETTGGTKLGHILIGYSGTTGAVLALVNMPRDFAAAQSIYCYTGKSGISATEESASDARAGGWLAWFKGGSVTDLTGQGRNLTTTGTPGSTTLTGWSAYDFDGLDDYGGGLSASGFLNGLSAVSCVTLAQADAINQLRGLFNVTNATEMELGLRYKGSAGRLVAAAKFGTSSYLYESADNSQATSPQAVAFVAPSGAAMRMAINGAMDTPSAGSGTLAGALSVTDALEWGRGGIGSIGYWNGPAAFLGLRSGGMSNAELESMTAALYDPRLVYGIGEANEVASSNRSPVALPVFSTGVAGSPTDVNVVTSAYDQNGDTLTVTDAAVASGLATATVPSSVSVRYIGNAGLEQSVAIDFGVRDPANKRSRGRLYATVAVPSAGMEYPPLTGTARYVNSVGEFAAKYAAAVPGDHVILADGLVFPARVTLDRFGTSAGAQIVVRAANPPSANSPEFRGGITIPRTAPWQWLWGIRHYNRGGNFSIAANNIRVRRVLFYDQNTLPATTPHSCVPIDGNDVIIEYCEMHHIWRRGFHWGPNTKRGKLLRSYIHHFLDPIGRASGSEPIRFGDAGPDYDNITSAADGHEVGYLFMEEVNLLQGTKPGEVGGEPEAENPSWKLPYGYLHHAHFKNTKSPTNRYTHHHRTELVRCEGSKAHFINGGIANTYNSCWTDGQFQIQRGDVDGAIMPAPGGSHPSSVDTTLIGCKGNVSVGYKYSAAWTFLATGTQIKSHVAGNLNLGPDPYTTSSAPSEVLGTPPTYTATSQGLLADL